MATRTGVTIHFSEPNADPMTLPAVCIRSDGGVVEFGDAEGVALAAFRLEVLDGWVWNHAEEPEPEPGPQYVLAPTITILMNAEQIAAAIQAETNNPERIRL